MQVQSSRFTMQVKAAIPGIFKLQFYKFSKQAAVTMSYNGQYSPSSNSVNPP